MEHINAQKILRLVQIRSVAIHVNALLATLELVKHVVMWTNVVGTTAVVTWKVFNHKF